MKEGLTPRELCDKYNALHVETYNWFQLSCVWIQSYNILHGANSSEGSTTSAVHRHRIIPSESARVITYSLYRRFQRICQDIYLHLKKNNLLEKQTKAQTYCSGCEKYVLTPSCIVGGAHHVSDSLRIVS